MKQFPLSTFLTTLLLAFPATNVFADESIYSPEKGKRSPLESCIVVVEPNENAIQKKDDVIRKTQLRPTANYRLIFNGMALSLSCDKLSHALSNETKKGLKLVPDSTVSAIKRGGNNDKKGGGGDNTNNTVPQQTPWQITSVGGSQSGEGLTAWIIDTGIDLQNADLNVDTANGFSVFKKGRRYLLQDDNGHGTHVAGIVAAKDNAIDALGVAAGASVGQ